MVKTTDAVTWSGLGTNVSIAEVTSVLIPTQTFNQMDEAKILDILRDLKIETFVPTIIYIVILMLMGIPGNLLVLYVYLTNWKTSTARVFILCLAWLDITFCLFVLPMELVVIYNPYVFDFPGLCKIFRFSSYTMSSTSGLILIAIAADRFHRICIPLKKHLTPRNAKIACAGSLGLALFFVWPSLVIYGIDQIEISTPMGNATISPCLIDHLYKNTHYPKYFFIFLFLATVANFVGLCILYGIIGFNIFRQSIKWKRSRSGGSLSTDCRSNTDSTNESGNETSVFLEDGTKEEQRHRKNSNIVMSPIVRSLSENKDVPRSPKCGLTSIRQHAVAQNSTGKQRTDSSNGIMSPRPMRLDSSISRQRRFTFSLSKVSGGKKTTLMLFVITVVYVVSFLPFLVLATLRSLNPKFGNFSEEVEMVYQLVLRSYLINSAMNPFIYSFCNNNFRQQCKRLFRKTLKTCRSTSL